MLKFIAITLLFALLTAAAEDPIGSFRVRVRGYVATGTDRPVAQFTGFAERLEIPDQNAFLARMVSQIASKSDTSNIARSSRDRPSSGAFIDSYVFEHNNRLDAFTTLTKDPRKLGDCLYFGIDQNSNFELGEWASGGMCGKNKEGTLYMRNSSFTDNDGKNIELSEAVCKSDSKLLWLESTGTIDGTLTLQSHADVIEESEVPALNAQSLAMFSIPAICVLKPTVVRSVDDAVSAVLDALQSQSAEQDVQPTESIVNKPPSDAPKDRVIKEKKEKIVKNKKDVKPTADDKLIKEKKEKVVKPTAEDKLLKKQKKEKVVKPTADKLMKEKKEKKEVKPTADDKLIKEKKEKKEVKPTADDKLLMKKKEKTEVKPTADDKLIKEKKEKIVKPTADDKLLMKKKEKKEVKPTADDKLIKEKKEKKEVKPTADKLTKEKKEKVVKPTADKLAKERKEKKEKVVKPTEDKLLVKEKKEELKPAEDKLLKEKEERVVKPTHHHHKKRKGKKDKDKLKKQKKDKKDFKPTAAANPKLRFEKNETVVRRPRRN